MYTKHSSILLRALKVLLIGVLCMQFSACAQNAIQISKAQPATIILPTTPIVSEETAAKELQHYLDQITGATCAIVQEDKIPGPVGSAIYVGATRFATQHLKGKSTFADEEWLMQTQGKSLILTGGKPRGALYATYHFLEDICGVHWWNPWEETVPTQKVLSIGPLNKRSQPAFHYRDIYSFYGNDNGRFATRSRIDRQGYAPIDATYGGSRTYGSPHEVHTFFDYLPPEKYYKDHPDWYIFPSGIDLTKGKFPHTNAQLCLANEGMRQEFLKVLRENIRTSRQAAIDKHLPPPEFYEVSQNDGGSVSWVGGSDVELVKKEGSDAASIISFVNYLADAIRDEYPDIYITTLAYHSGEKAPKTLRPRDNVIVRLTDTQSNVLLPVTADRNKALCENVEAWAKLAKNLRIWDYDITYIQPGLPTPTLQTYSPDLQFFLNHNVEGMFVEFEQPVTADMRDLKVWVLCKLLEDPTQNTNALVRQFTDGFYGAAGPYVRQYLTALQESVNETTAKQGMSEITWFSGLSQYSYLTPEFLFKANQLFDQAASSVSDNPTLSQRVRNACAPIDYAILMLYPRLVKNGSNLSINRELIARRFLQTRNEQITLRYPLEAQAAKRQELIDQINDLNTVPAQVPLPDQFNIIPAANIHVYDFRDANPAYSEVFHDPSAPSQVVSRLVIPDSQTEKYKLPMPVGVYGQREKKHLLDTVIKQDEVKGPGYHWYKIGSVAPTSSSYVFFTRSWYIQLYISDVANSHNSDQQYDVWANIKLDGPIFSYGNPKDKNAALVDRVILVKR
jgi:hypothetical protein